MKKHYLTYKLKNWHQFWFVKNDGKFEFSKLDNDFTFLFEETTKI